MEGELFGVKRSLTCVGHCVL